MGQVLYAYLSGRRLAPSAGSKEVADLDGQTQAQPPIKISVRNLVEFVMRSGDLDNRRTAGAKKEARQAAGCTGRYRNGWEAVTARKWF